MCTPPTNKDTTIIQLAYWQLRIRSLTFRLNIKDARDNCDLFFVSARRGKYERMKKVSMFAFFLARKRKSKRRNFHFSSCALLNVIIGKQPQNATPFWKKKNTLNALLACPWCINLYTYEPVRNFLVAPCSSHLLKFCCRQCCTQSCVASPGFIKSKLWEFHFRLHFWLYLPLIWVHKCSVSFLHRHSFELARHTLLGVMGDITSA